MIEKGTVKLSNFVIVPVNQKFLNALIRYFYFIFYKLHSLFR